MQLVGFSTVGFPAKTGSVSADDTENAWKYGNYVESEYLRYEDGELMFPADEEGNQIPDFSWAGYRLREDTIPDVPTVKKIGPVERIAKTGSNGTPDYHISDRNYYMRSAQPSIVPTIDGPNGNVSATIDPEGEISIELDGTTILEPSPYNIPASGSFPDEFNYEGVETREIDETYKLAHGKRKECRHRATEAVFTYEAARGVVELQVRIATDGVAYRYRYPGDEGSVGFLTEGSAFNIPREAIGYLMPYVYHHESSGRTVPVSEIDDGREYQFPGLFQVEKDSWVLLCEAGVDGDWAAGRLTFDGDDGLFEITHPPNIARSPRPVDAPWRVAIVGDLATVTESTLTTDLVDGPRIDADWVEPGRVAWSWWSTGTGDLELGKAYVDYVNEHGWEHILIDAGWGRDWMPELVEYADERDVGVFVWAHFTELNSESKRAERLPKWADWGIAGVKVDFMDSDDQGRLQFYDAMAEACAEQELMVNYHGSIIPTGLRRRWPHVMTYEGVMGAEKHPGIASEHNTILPFTRNVVGPMDYTPVTFSAESLQTVGHELALSIVFESGLQHYADSIDEYTARPLAQEVLDAVPATWDETRFLRGKPGAEVTLARRSGDEWFIGCITAGPNRTVDVHLDFVDGEREVTVTRDEGDGETLMCEREVASETLSIPVPENGGFVARL
ncbi:glycoside hydrolase family 97 catalytic domain-containing protein [Haladaptatus pallidirubidus]|uniref:Glycoside hydrolase family 97 protein n=1 Tax=Haladaptatus pallidirubidus TaxID=1008152 RepID=A0AAV3UQ72_9EURY|nr:glycoside hydrolase family 97 protein [Haladaptatus pallidirubidus]